MGLAIDASICRNKQGPRRVFIVEEEEEEGEEEESGREGKKKRKRTGGKRRTRIETRIETSTAGYIRLHRHSFAIVFNISQ